MPKGDFDNDTEVARLDELDKKTRHYFESKMNILIRKEHKIPESSDTQRLCTTTRRMFTISLGLPTRV